MFRKGWGFIKTQYSDPRIRRLLVLNIFNTIGFIFLNGGVRLFLFPFLSRILGGERFGNFLTTFSFSNTISVMPGMAIMLSMAKIHANYRGEKRIDLFRTMGIFATLVGPFLAIIFWFAMPLVDKIFTNVDLVAFRTPLAFYLAVFFISTIFGSILGYEKKYINQFVFDGTAGVLCLLAFPIFHLFGRNAAMYTLFISYAVIVPGQIMMCRKIIFSGGFIDKALLNIVFKISVFYFSCSAVDSILEYGNRWIIGYYLNASAVSAYYVGFSVVTMFSVFFGMVARLETLVISQKATIKDIRYSDMKLLGLMVLSTSIFVPILTLFAGKYVLFLLYEENIARSGLEVFYILIILLFIRPFKIFLRPIVIKYCSPRVPLIFGIISTVVTVGFGLVFVPFYGITGAAVGTCLASLVASSLYLVQFLRKIYFPVLRLNKR